VAAVVPTSTSIGTEEDMRHKVKHAPASLAALGLLAAFAACAGNDTADNTATKDSPAAAPAAVASSSAKVPLTSGSEEAKTLYARGRDLSEQLRTQDARKLFLEAVAKDSMFAMAHYSLAQTSPTSNEFIQHLTRAVALAPNASEGERIMILALEAGVKANPAKSLQYTEELVAKYPRDERAHLNLGNAYGGRQQNEKAIAEYQKAIEINPGYSPAYNSLGYAYRAVGNNAEAEKAFMKYIELVPNDPNPYDSYGELLMKMGRFDESIEQYRKALAIDPNFGSSHVGIAADLMYAGKPEAAIAEAQKLYDAARDNGDRRSALFAQAVTYLDGGKTAQASSKMEQLYAMAAKDADTVTMAGDAAGIGDVLLNAGRVDEARKRYDQSLALVTKSSFPAEVKADAALGARYNTARVALAKGDLATAKSEAAAYLQGAEAQQSDFRIRQAHELAGIIALEEKQSDDAIAHLGKANQQDPYVVYMTSMAYMAKGDAAKAKELSQQAASSYTLPTLHYAFVRAKAKKAA
jgi:tetratricopeptide (TPR) repeat protein